MKPHPKIRKTVKWVGAVATVLLVVAWVGSACYAVIWFGRGDFTAWVGAGFLQVGHMPADSEGALVPGLTIVSFAPNLQWGSQGTREDAPWGAVIPLWAFVIPALGITVAAWRLDMLARRRVVSGVGADGASNQDATAAEASSAVHDVVTGAPFSTRCERLSGYPSHKLERP